MKKMGKLVSLMLAGGVPGVLMALALGATAVGVLGAGLGAPALVVFAVGGAVCALAIYGCYRLFNDD